ncbi:hypothetical protein FB567DRAFT_528804 [Paraphoma chrysanthemicola]|uniref:Uncharacterized protein n=1 Tax=Paraphoma chrysanthemicola TaxID=798071 RepID=A0A8K0R5K9_9PLEO|nr:hypothetical protein FB567DRAFT_528804 [Paraphoma chrysanthemicola]
MHQSPRQKKPAIRHRILPRTHSTAHCRRHRRNPPPFKMPPRSQSFFLVIQIFLLVASRLSKNSSISQNTDTTQPLTPEEPHIASTAMTTHIIALQHELEREVSLAQDRNENLRRLIVPPDEINLSQYFRNRDVLQRARRVLRNCRTRIQRVRNYENAASRESQSHGAGEMPRSLRGFVWMEAELNEAIERVRRV